MKNIFTRLKTTSKAHVPLLVIGGLFSLLAGRTAFTKPFPLPYDENYHFGLIKLYAHHLNPFLSTQPQGADSLGAVARDPSYFYHYLLSFPLRLLQALGLNVHTQILVLRSLNIALGLGTLYVVYRLALRIGLSAKTAWLPVLALAITPVFYELSAQVNYDNLFIGLTVLTVLAVLSITDKLRAGTLPIAKLCGFTALVLLASIVKYSYLPIAFAATLFVALSAYKHIGLKRLLTQLRHGFAGISSIGKVALIVLVAVSGLLWYQRDGLNIVLYYTPHPQCQIALGVEQCAKYAPWARNYQLRQTSAQRPQDGLQVVAFTKYWFRAMVIETYSSIHAHNGVVVYSPYAEARTVAKSLIAFGALLATAFVLFSKRARVLWMPGIIVCAAYLAALWVQNFSDFHHLHSPIAIQGRYLLPAMPFVYLFATYGYTLFTRYSIAEATQLQGNVAAGIKARALRPVTAVLKLAGTVRLV
ncbi:MAG TPA: glycosyltransferase family 39 protein [Candidatus Saccharimonadales bacterium]|nr:glycosyltransferase family 39 protein [Candidatus Saccharimonadales bacterium]